MSFISRIKEPAHYQSEKAAQYPAPAASFAQKKSTGFSCAWEIGSLNRL
ncbi:hypothetical protein BCO26_0730 [Heyndrickxia coagulans 2-6]|jgi:hypothetical protein|nr:hypothetical protein BCO26_0730 [Heyndrickxia coagulans 2-6]